jgi:hypothetical protein
MNYNNHMSEDIIYLIANIYWGQVIKTPKGDYTTP